MKLTKNEQKIVKEAKNKYPKIKNIYRYNGKLGTLVYYNNRKWAEENNLRDDTFGHIFIELDKVSEFIDNSEIDWDVGTYSDSYNEYEHDDIDINIDDMPCYENKQGYLNDVWDYVELQNKWKIESELYITTDRYYKWNSEREHMLREIKRCAERDDYGRLAISQKDYDDLKKDWEKEKMWYLSKYDFAENVIDDLYEYYPSGHLDFGALLEEANVIVK